MKFLIKSVVFLISGVRKYIRRPPTKNMHTCLFCNDAYINKGMLKKHVFESHKDLKDCKLCGKIFATVKVLSEHLHQYHKERNVKCQVCVGLKGDRKYRTSLALVKHIHQVHCMTESAMSKRDIRLKGSAQNRAISNKYLDVRNCCKRCYVGYKSLDMLEQHFQTIHTSSMSASPQLAALNITRYCCDRCNKVYQLPGHLQQHLKGDKHNECGHCTKRFKTKRGLTVHEIQLHNKCPRSRDSFIDEELYQHHLAKKHSYCSVCFERFCCEKDRRYHIEKNHRDSKTKECDRCGQKFLYASAAVNHMINKTCQRKQFRMENRVLKSLKEARKRAALAKICYKCKFCKAGSESLVVMKNHLKFSHTLEKHVCLNTEFSDEVLDQCITSNLKVFYCTLCPRVFSNYSGHLRHMRRKKDQHLHCKTCLKTVKTKNALVVHERRVHDINCSMSPDVFYSREHYESHLTKPHHVCEVCFVTFCTSKRLYEHKLAVHKASFVDKTKWKQCMFCQKKYLSYGGLNQHLRQCHGPGGKHYCDTCNLYFSSIDLLSAHTTGSKRCREKLFSCSFCSEKFSSKNRCQKHIKKKHDVFVCSMCATNCQNQGELVEHQKVCRVSVDKVTTSTASGCMIVIR